jgi:hypothetical protein
MDELLDEPISEISSLRWGKLLDLGEDFGNAQRFTLGFLFTHSQLVTSA